MCLYSELRENKKWKPNKKNGGNPPTMKDPRTQWVAYRCGKCMECRKQKAREWSVRLQEEIKEDRTGKFVTLTFSNESIYKIINGDNLNQPIKNLEGYELDNEIAKTAVRRFLERWRKKHGKSVKHWLITELGQPSNKRGHQGTENLHIHGIIFSDKVEDIKTVWQYGFVYIGKYVGNDTINYCVKYSTKVDEEHPGYKAKILTSAGIGAGYLKDVQRHEYKKGKTKEGYKTESGQEMNMPAYWRNKIWNEEIREELWIEKLDKNERYVDGRKIDTSEGMDEYYAALKEAQAKGRRLGYGDNSKDWQRDQYERTRRKAMYKKRLEKFGDNEEM